MQAKAIFTIDTDIYLGLQPCKIPLHISWSKNVDIKCIAHDTFFE